MAVKPHKKLIDKEKGKNFMRNHPCYPKRNGSKGKVSVQKVFLLDKALNPGSEWFSHMIFFQIIKLVNNSTGQNRDYGTENNTVDFKIEDKFSKGFILVEKEKRRNIQGKGKKGSYEKTGTDKKAHEL